MIQLVTRKNIESYSLSRNTWDYMIQFKKKELNGMDIEMVKNLFFILFFFNNGWQHLNCWVGNP